MAILLELCADERVDFFGEDQIQLHLLHQFCAMDMRWRLSSRAYRVRKRLRVEGGEGLLLRGHILRVDVAREGAVREVDFRGGSVVAVDVEHDGGLRVRLRLRKLGAERMGGRVRAFATGGAANRSGDFSGQPYKA